MPIQHGFLIHFGANGQSCTLIGDSGTTPQSEDYSVSADIAEAKDGYGNTIAATAYNLSAESSRNFHLMKTGGVYPECPVPGSKITLVERADGDQELAGDYMVTGASKSFSNDGYGKLALKMKRWPTVTLA